MTLPFACLSNVWGHTQIVFGWWSVLFVAGVAGIVISLFRGSKHKQLLALAAIPAFVPITGLGFLGLYLLGLIRLSAF